MPAGELRRVLLAEVPQPDLLQQELGHVDGFARDFAAGAGAVEMLSRSSSTGKAPTPGTAPGGPAPGPLIGAPLSLMLPLSGSSNPASRRISVLLPQPEGPIMTVSLLRSIVKEQSFTTQS
jgi:hypothetical protein